MRIMKRITAAAMTAVLAVSLCPAPALANGALAATGAKETQTVVATQGKKKATKKVYVLKSFGRTSGFSSDVVYKYKSNGLLEASTTHSEQDGESYRTKYGYNKKGYVTSESIFTKDDGETTWKKGETTSITRNAKGLPKKKIVQRGHTVDVTAFTIKSGRVVAEKTTHKYSNGTSETDTAAYTYDTHGRVKSVDQTKYNQTSRHRYNYYYDKRGNYVKYEREYGTYQLALTYNSKKLLTKRDNPDGDVAFTYRYKAMKVPASMVGKVKAQQWSLLNQNLNFVL